MKQLRRFSQLIIVLLFVTTGSFALAAGVLFPGAKDKGGTAEKRGNPWRDGDTVGGGGGGSNDDVGSAPSGKRLREGGGGDSKSSGGCDDDYGVADCGTINIDCASHHITVQGVTEKIDCGRPGLTENGTGRIGARYYSTKLRQCAFRMNPRPRGMSSGMVFHVMPLPPRAPQTPLGLNSSAGCIHVSARMKRMIGNCQGSPFKITGAIGNNGSGGRKKKSGGTK